MDPLSDVLSLLKPKNYLSAVFEAGGDWSVQFPDQQQFIKTGAIVSGQCWLSVDGIDEPVLMKTGDCFLLPSGRPFRMASDRAIAPVAAAEVFTTARRDGVVRYNGGGDFSVISSRFAIGGGNNAGILLKVLPAIVHIRSDQPGHAALRWSMERMEQELREQQPGGFLVVDHLAQMMLVQALRMYLSESRNQGIGWLFALADKQIGATIKAMHDDPAYRWTLETLAERAGMSRSTFALKFKGKVGKAPMEYLASWRMLLAGDRLANSGDPVSRIALSLGYESESAFSTAFKKMMGCSPRQYGRARLSTSSPDMEAAAG